MLAGTVVPWWLSAGVVVLISTSAAYLFGIAGGARLGSRVASFVGLFEVLFAVLAAWALLGDLPAPIQLVGGVLILVGVVLVKPAARGAGGGGSATAHASPAFTARHRAAHSRRSDNVRDRLIASIG